MLNVIFNDISEKGFGNSFELNVIFYAMWYSTKEKPYGHRVSDDASHSVHFIFLWVYYKWADLQALFVVIEHKLADSYNTFASIRYCF